jgi:O-antigen/teichoic acid export membrane protein
MAIGSVVAPRFSAEAQRADRSALVRLARRASLLSTLATLPLVLLFVFAGAPVMAIFGPAFVAGAPLLAVIVLGHLAIALTGPAGLLLNMTGHQGAESLITVGAAVLLVALCALCVPRWGAMGAAAANAAALACCSVLRAAVVRRRLGVLPLPGL